MKDTEDIIELITSISTKIENADKTQVLKMMRLELIKKLDWFKEEILRCEDAAPTSQN